MSRELTRRDFLGDAALVGVASAIGIENALASQAEAAATPPRERRTSFDDGWSFAKGDIAGAQSPQFTGGIWTPVHYAPRLEHRWPLQRERSHAAARALTCPPASAGTASRFQLPRSDAGRRILLQFDGVYQCSDVWINGQHLGTRPYGFTTVLLRPHSAPSLRRRAEPRRRARGQLAPAQPALVLRLRNQSPHLAHQHRPGLHRAVGHRRHHSADHCAELPPSKSPRACAISLRNPHPAR